MPISQTERIIRHLPEPVGEARAQRQGGVRVRLRDAGLENEPLELVDGEARERFENRPPSLLENDDRDALACRREEAVLAAEGEPA
jgi:hypothetical protein